MIKRILVAVALVASHLASSAALAQDSLPCLIFWDRNGVQCGTGGTEPGATNWVILGGTLPAFAGSNSVAVGPQVRANGDSSVAVGMNSISFGQLSTAIGFSADALALNTLALGANSTVTFAGANSVALGAGSVANEANVVSIGTVGGERRLLNVAVPIGLTDAANRQYVDNEIDGVLFTAQDFATFAADQARQGAQTFANNLLFSGSSNASLQSATVGTGGIQVTGGGNINVLGGTIDVNGGGINNAGRITGVANGIGNGGDSVSRVGIGFEF